MRPIFCQWAARQPQDPIEMRTIREISGAAPVRLDPAPCDEAEFERRQDLCWSCPHVVRLQMHTGTCPVDHQPLDAKCRIAAERCPLVPPRWGPAPVRSLAVTTMAVNALGAAARAIASGFATVDQAEVERRLEICRGCDHFDAAQGRCRLCGCVARWKARLQSEHCPDKPPRW